MNIGSFKNIKEVAIVIVAISAIIVSLAFYSLKETERKNRIKTEEQLQTDKILKKKADKELSLAQENRDFIMRDAEKKRQEAESLEAELVSHRREIELAKQKIAQGNNNVSYIEQRIKQTDSNISELSGRIANVVKDSLKLTEELQLLEKTKDALKARLAEYLKERRSAERVDIKTVPVRIEPETEVSEKAANTPATPVLAGEVLTVNREFNFIVVNLGRGDGIKEGTVLDICRDNKRLGRAEVETVRENISAAALTDKDSISHMRPGDRAFLY